MELYDLKTAGTRLFSKDIQIDRIKWLRLTKHLELPMLYEELECSLNSTLFWKGSVYKIVKTSKSEMAQKGQERG